MEKIYQEHIERIKDSGKHRRLPQCRQDYSADFLNFSTNDYLGLSRHPKILFGAANALKAYGFGATGSRLISGNTQLHEALEAEIAAGKKTAKALFFATGFQANTSALSALIDPAVLKQKPLVFFDRLNHASLYQAVLKNDVTLIRYRHLQVDHLEEFLEKYKNDDRPKFIVTETIFGMDGDRVLLEPLIKLAKNYNCFLYLDEAHATGLYGEKGYGLSTNYDLSGITHVVMGSFSKALGGQGGYVASSENICEFLLHKANGFIYSTAPAPVILGGALAAWQLIPELDAEREHLQSLALELRKSLNNLSINTGQSDTHIIPLATDNEAHCLKLQHALLQEKIIVSAIRPPTVPPGTSRLRIALSAKHSFDDIDRLVKKIRKTLT